MEHGALELPSSWHFIETVLPQLELDRAGGYAMKAPWMVAEGLALMEDLSEAAAFALVWENEFTSCSGLHLALNAQLVAKGEVLRERYSTEAAFTGRSEWNVRRVLLTALVIQARRLGEKWTVPDLSSPVSPPMEAGQ